MKESVGRVDQTLRSVVGPVLLTLGYTSLDGKRGRTAGLVAMISGALLVESAITRVCPVNALLGLDTRRWDPAFQRGTDEGLKGMSELSSFALLTAPAPAIAQMMDDGMMGMMWLWWLIGIAVLVLLGAVIWRIFKSGSK